MAAPFPKQRSGTWFLERWPYRLFVLRELSTVVVAAYLVVLLLLAGSVYEGAEAFGDFVSMLQSPAFVVFHVVAMLFALLHSVTWFQAVPKGLPLRRGEERVAPALLIGANYVAMAVVTAVVVVAVLV
jgi:fumarate reductase subunit C